jgi:hypothetical protein
MNWRFTWVPWSKKGRSKLGLLGIPSIMKFPVRDETKKPPQGQEE